MIGMHAVGTTVRPCAMRAQRRGRPAARRARKAKTNAQGRGPAPKVASAAARTDEVKNVKVDTKFVAETLLPTRTGKFRVRAYRHTVDGTTFSEPMAICYGMPEDGEDIPVRVHDACFTSEVLGSLKCDCAEQLQYALDFVQSKGCGIVIYLQQEGRGIGLANKIAAYRLQETGLDTVDANRALGLPDDCREYTSVRNILADMGIKSIQLMTNNPRKIRLLKELGVDVSGRIPVQIEANEVNAGYLTSKKIRMDHLLVDEKQKGKPGAAATPRSVILDNSVDESYWEKEGIWDSSDNDN
ncbi:unnamed protein product [Pedinophyceae sp. YPF-701]|nr:unnamed protein product [Pedinophyceae sp. YPF-701]